MDTSTAFQMTPVGESSRSSEPMPGLCRFGRFSVQTRTAIYYGVGSVVGFIAGCSVGVFVGRAVAGTVAKTVAGIVAGAVTGGPVAAAAGPASGIAADALYVKYRHGSPTDSPEKLTEATDNNPETINEMTPLSTDRPDLKTTATEGTSLT